MGLVPTVPHSGELPSGCQYEIRHAAQVATIVEVGGALRAYSVGGADLLDGYGPTERCTGGRGQTLLPWPNRLCDGKYDFSGETLQLALSEPAKRNAIHGLVRWTNFAAVDQAADEVTMVQLLHPQPGYPFTLEVRIRYQLSADGLTVTTVATNRGHAPAPFGSGAHPYLRPPAGRLDETLLSAPGSVRLVND